MPTLDVSELNVVLGVLGKRNVLAVAITPTIDESNLLTGTFIVLYGVISVKIKSRWYLGEACALNLNDE